MLRRAAWLLDPAPSADSRNAVEYDKLLTRLEADFIAPGLYLNSAVSVDMVAEQLGTNRTYLKNALRRRGMTFSSYINSYRLWHAASLMARNRKMDLSEVAEVSGFTNMRSLNYFVSRRYGITLVALRQRIYQLLSELQEEQTLQLCRKDV